MPLSDSSGPLVTSKAVVCRDNQCVGSEAVLSAGPPLSGGRGGDSSMLRTMAAAYLPVERSNLVTRSSPTCGGKNLECWSFIY